jgi:abequosyltransferase
MSARKPNIALSVCIPTYNFGAYIGETLESIASQLRLEVEVVVIDGASTDNTPAVVDAFRDRIPNLVYVRRSERGGIDKDMALAVEAARGTYCWLFSADDLMEPGAIDFVLREIASGSDLYLCQTTLCSFDFTRQRPYPNIALATARTFDLSNPFERSEYFRLALNTQPFFSFCGALVFRKDRWDASHCEEEFIGSCWAHAVRILNMMPDGLRVRVLPRSLSLKRGGNDSFEDRGLANRVRIGIEGYENIARHFFGAASLEAAEIRRCLRAEYTVRHMLYAKLRVHDEGTADDRKLLNRLFESLYSGPGVGLFLRRVIYRMTPIPLLRLLGKFKSRF